MKTTNITEANEAATSIIDARTKRDELSERIEVLEKVKALVLLPNIGMLTARQIADFYETDLKTIQKVYSRHRAEIQSDGYVTMIGRDLVKKLEVDTVSTSNITVKRGHTELEVNGEMMKISNSTVRLYSARAALRFGMLLHDCKIAQKVRTQLLNIRDNADDHTRTKAIDAELIELREKAAKYDALIGDMPPEIAESYDNIIRYEREKREAAQKEAAQLETKVTRFIEDPSLVPFDHVALKLRLNSQQLRSKLQDVNVLRKKVVGGVHTPIGEYRNKGWFEIQYDIGSGIVQRPQLFVTRDGIIGITEKIDEFEVLFNK
ncbi:hypothetical protein ACQVTS_17375 [Bacillus mycoides]|uniref:hypothetical protein n=1 Tax=Bacillus mycoides TaxID=1405 RepID=UPI003D65F1C0